MGQMFGLPHVAQLHEIQQARLRAGQPGIAPEVEELIQRLTSGGVAGKFTDPREIAAKLLWDKGFGNEAGVDSFEAYLAQIPEIPQSLLADDSEMPLLSLADPRPGLLKACELIGIRHAELGYSEGNVVPCDDRHTDPTEPFWFRHDDGRGNRNRRPDLCRDECTGDVLAGTAFVGAFAYLHHQQIVVEDEHILDLPGSVHRDSRFDCAYLGVWGGRVGLCVYGGSGEAGPECGSLRFRRK